MQHGDEQRRLAIRAHTRSLQVRILENLLQQSNLKLGIFLASLPPPRLAAHTKCSAYCKAYQESSLGNAMYLIKERERERGFGRGWSRSVLCPSCTHESLA